MSLYRNRGLIAGGQRTSIATASVGATITGSVVTAVTAAAGIAGSQEPIADRIVAIAMSLGEAGAGVTISGCTINGIPAPVWVQENQAGALAFICSANIPFGVADRRFRFRGILSASGATAGNGVFDISRGSSCYSPVSYTSSGAAIDTARTATLSCWPSGLVIAAATNDVATANSCAWTGTVGVVEDYDEAAGTARISGASDNTPTAGEAQTAIATFAVTSVAGISLAAASFR